MNPYTLLSELYRLLGVVDDETLQATDRMPLPNEMRAIIAALITAKKHGFPVPPIPLPSTPSGREQASESLPTRVTITEPIWDLSGLVDSDLSNKRLVDLLGRAGLDIKMRKKEGRGSLIRKAQRKLSQLDDEKRDRVLSKLQRLAGIDQTSGWMKVIHSERNK
jgi:hypothetical protein